MEEIVREHSRFLDVAVIIAGDPETRGEEHNTSVAKELIGIKNTIVCMVHFGADSCASRYPAWYAEFELAMAARDDADTCFMSFMMPGTMDGGGRSLWFDWDFTKVNPDRLVRGDVARRARFHLSA